MEKIEKDSIKIEDFLQKELDVSDKEINYIKQEVDNILDKEFNIELEVDILEAILWWKDSEEKLDDYIDISLFWKKINCNKLEELVNKAEKEWKDKLKLTFKKEGEEFILV